MKSQRHATIQLVWGAGPAATVESYYKFSIKNQMCLNQDELIVNPVDSALHLRYQSPIEF